ncbi:MAG: hypothetical protein IJB58_04945 [Bacteroidales bacterium]|nr:hypothetical protein [Bacteroidales bacterium]
MRKSRIKGIFLAILVFMVGVNISKAQTTDALGTYTPYSLYGIGEIVKQGTAINRGMGGIGVGVRDNRYINYLNPASITQRDTLSFMLDFGISQKNFYNSDGKTKSAYNTFNMHNIVFTAPIYKKSALIVGISPYSDIGYKFESTETDKELVSKYGDIKYQKYGTGSINQFFIGASMNFFKHFSLGAEYIYYFGALDRYSNVMFNTSAGSMRSLETGWDYALGASSARIGIQYFGILDKEKDVDLTVGATYRMAAKLKGDFNRFAYAYDENVRDTVVNTLSEDAKIKIPQEFSAGFSIRKKDKWMFGFDYMRQDWTKSSFEGADGVKFKPCVAGYYKAGFEFTPNKYDIRYYMKRVTYRLGAYYEQSYVQLGSHQINAAGITFGMSLPIYRLYNAVNVAVDFGQRGTVKENLVRERYVQFVVNISLHDIWFVKHQYQ